MDDSELLVDLTSDDGDITRERRGAALYDILVVSWATGAIVLPLGLVWADANRFQLLILWLLLVLVEGVVGASPGKIVTGLRVESTEGNRPGLLRAAVRRPWVLGLGLVLAAPPVARFASVAAMLVLLAMSLTIDRDEMGRGFHDRLAGTQVVRTEVVPAARLAVVVVTALMVLATAVLAAMIQPTNIV